MSDPRRPARQLDYGQPHRPTWGMHDIWQLVGTAAGVALLALGLVSLGIASGIIFLIVRMITRS